ncbi:hypothetical protein [Pseudoduganella chitinolytica]|uniref:Tetratricopeptide repeat protein n=1 Tax=Pseudoduganella chitinolytica TaxID=34070 RepID=A0ABY8BFV0_9BURK|nr:hypothetical protein [Pseudoduganella chitinolytica]WEF34802.1 hypothetical protein PX653_08585 [Pseudoduganella chitinolytica]
MAGRRATPAATLLLALALGAQLAWHGWAPPPAPATAGLAPPPAPAVLRLVGLGEDAALARLLMLALQAHDAQAGAALSLHALDYGRVVPWLERALALDPRGRYPLVAASAVYAAVPDPARVRVMLAFIERAFHADPARRWPFLAQAALIARHRLHDLPLARQYARTLRLRAPAAPAWARQLEAFVLEDMDEPAAARAVIGALLAGGQVTDPNELRFLARRLDELAGREAARRTVPAAQSAPGL